MNTIPDAPPPVKPRGGPPAAESPAPPAPEAAPAPDRAEIGRAVTARLALSPWVELRAIPPAGAVAESHWVGPGGDADAAAAWAVKTNRAGYGVYATFNVIEARPEGSAKDDGVAGRSLIFIDIDPERDADTSATEEQRAEAASVADAVMGELRGRCWGDPRLAPRHRQRAGAVLPVRAGRE